MSDNDYITEDVVTDDTTNEVPEDLALETDMPKARALRRRARFYTEAAHGQLHTAHNLLEGRSGLDKYGQVTAMTEAIDALREVGKSLQSAVADMEAAVLARAEED